MNVPSSVLRRAACLAGLAAAVLAAAPALAERAPAAPPVSVVTLGTGGGPIVRLQRSETANAVVVGKTIYLVDAGDRVLRQLAAAHLPLTDVRVIFITHHHLDHTAGLMPLLGLRWMNNILTPLKLYGPAGLNQVVQGFEMSVQPSVDAGFGARQVDPISPLDVHEIAGPGLVYQDDNVRVLAAENTHYTAPVGHPEHAPKSYAYRFETPRGVVVFTGDTGPSEAVTKLAAGADLLVSEIINVQVTIDGLRKGGDRSPPSPAVVRHLEVDHLTPEQVGKLAQAAGVKRLVLSHFSPGLDGEDVERTYTAGVRGVYKGPVTAASDLQVFTLP